MVPGRVSARLRHGFRGETPKARVTNPCPEYFDPARCCWGNILYYEHLYSEDVPYQPPLKEGNVKRVPIIRLEPALLCDPAIAHIYIREVWTFVLTRWGKVSIDNLVNSDSVLEDSFGEMLIKNTLVHTRLNKHKGRGRSRLSANGANSPLTPATSHGGSLDTIGLAGFPHDFGSLDGNPGSVTDIFNSFEASPLSALDTFIHIIAWYSGLDQGPDFANEPLKKPHQRMGNISNVVLDRTRKKEHGVLDSRKKFDYWVAKYENDGAEPHLSPEEVMAQTYAFAAV
ncbi:hypothetical protein BU15DRAFT_62176 [Melanogaster broomeanus]|nr:hypothetical protein BU15DRAFT_62176 [Melanogaster broomeanus]